MGGGGNEKSEKRETYTSKKKEDGNLVNLVEREKMYVNFFLISIFPSHGPWNIYTYKEYI